LPVGPDDRTAEMLKLRQAGWTFDEIGELYGVTGVRVLQILQPLGLQSSPRGRRRHPAENFHATVESFVEEHRDVIEALASSGATRFDVVERFRLFMPEIELTVIAHGITASGVVFADDRAFSFSSAVTACAVWYVLAVSLNLDCNRLTAMKEADIREAREIYNMLHAGGLDENTVARVLCRAACAREYARAHPEASLTRKRYDSIRLRIIDELGFQSGKGTAWWPPTGLTVMKRLGNGYWADALSAIGIASSSKGRPRGLVQFDPKAYEAAITEYLRYAAAIGGAPTQAGYQEWVDGEQRAGRHKPSFAAVRLRYGTWFAAMRVAPMQTAPGSPSRRTARAEAALSVRALHDAQQEVDRFVTELSRARRPATSALVESFTTSYVDEFLYRRTKWLQAIILRDDTVVARRLADPSTSKKIRDGLSRTSSDLHALLSDMYVGNIGGSDPRRTDGWLRPDAQAELNAVPDNTVARYNALKQARNYLTHNSEEARDRLSAAIQELSAADPRFDLKQSITNRVVIDWLRAKDARRLRLLTSGVVGLWRAMVIAESILAGPSGSSYPKNLLGEPL
jgi:hypothetical protein